MLYIDIVLKKKKNIPCTSVYCHISGYSQGTVNIS